jgi:hypothetical protein
MSYELAVSSVVRAKKFEVVGSYGRVVATLSERALDIYDSNGKLRATLRLQYNDKGVLAFSDERWEGRALFGFLGTDTPSSTDDDWGISLRDHRENAPVVSIVVPGSKSDGSISVRRSGGPYAVWP